jgi:hypothetical protein
MRHIIEVDPQLRLALPDLVEQPRVLHRDDCLRRETLQQRDLLLSERSHFLAIEGDRVQEGAFLAQRHRDHRAGAAELDEGAPRRALVAGLGGDVDLMHDGIAVHQFRQTRAGRPEVAVGPQKFGGGGGDPAKRDD